MATSQLPVSNARPKASPRLRIRLSAWARGRGIAGTTLAIVSAGSAVLVLATTPSSVTSSPHVATDSWASAVQPTCSSSVA